MQINNKQRYIGSYLSEELAARVYDILSIKNRGIKARTNFKYNYIQKKNISESKINLKSDNISDIIKQLTN
jgi:GDP-D-mannose dehydratase